MNPREALAFLGAFALAGCGGGTSDPQRPHGTPEPGACGSPGGRPGALGDAPAPSMPVSRITLDLTVSKRRIASEIAARVPETVASARRQDAGAPGEVTYTVRRGPIGVSVRDGRLLVSTPIRASLEVCKPLGPFCPVYGACQPELLASISVPLDVDASYRTGPSQVSFATTKRCILAPVGLDVTSEIERQANREAAGLRRRIDDQLPTLAGPVGAMWKLLHVPMALDADTCLLSRPEKIVTAAPQESADDVRVRAAVTGSVSVARPCPTAPLATPSLPAPHREAVDEGVHVNVPVVLPWSEVSSALTRSVWEAPSDGSPRVRAMTASGASLGGAGKVALEVTLASPSCTLWLVADARWEPRTAKVVLANVVSPTEPADARARSAAALIERAGHVALPLDVSEAPARLRAQLRGLGEGLPAGAVLHADLEPAVVETVLVSADALRPVVSLRGRVGIAVK